MISAGCPSPAARLRYITNTGMNDLAALSVQVILRMSALYLVLRIIDAMANFYMAYTGHVMGTQMETDMRRDAYGLQFSHSVPLSVLSASGTPRAAAD